MLPALLALFVFAAVVAACAVALRFAPAALVGGRAGALWTLFVAVTYKVNARYHYEDGQGRNVSPLPLTLSLTGDDIVGNKLLFVDADNDKKYVVPPGPPGSGAVGIRFDDFKVSADKVADAGDTHALELLLGPTGQSTGFKLSEVAAATVTGVDAAARMQDLNTLVFGVGQTISFAQRAA